MPSKFQGTTGNRGGKVPAIGPGGTLRDEGIFSWGISVARPALNVAEGGRGSTAGKGQFENERLSR